jgi:hypothetical protein
MFILILDFEAEEKITGTQNFFKRYEKIAGHPISALDIIRAAETESVKLQDFIYEWLSRW